MNIDSIIHKVLNITGCVAAVTFACAAVIGQNPFTYSLVA